MTTQFSSIRAFKLGDAAWAPLLVVASSITAGSLVVSHPVVVVGIAVAIAVVWWWVCRSQSARFVDLFVCVLAGNLILGYGFANIGVSGPIPLPFADIALLLFALMMLRRRAPLSGANTLPFIAIGVFIAYAALRLPVDFARWRQDAVRDFTLPFEATYIFVGYYAAGLIPMRRLKRILAAVFFTLVVYNLTLIALPGLAAASPTVGLSHSVHLLSGANGPALVAAFFFFAMVRPWGMWSYVIAAVALSLNAVSESRGLYVGLPVILLLVWFGTRRADVRRGLLASLCCGLVALILLFIAAPQGRLGRVTPSFVTAQIGTLFGHAGPGAGSLTTRENWIGTVRRAVDARATGWAFGVGLGPDLAGGARSATGVLIRKPHNDFLEIFGRYGIAGALIFLVFIGSGFHALGRAARRASDEETIRIVIWALGTSAIYAVIAATQPLLAFPYGTVPFFGALGLGLHYAREQHVRVCEFRLAE